MCFCHGMVGWEALLVYPAGKTTPNSMWVMYTLCTTRLHWYTLTVLQLCLPGQAHFSVCPNITDAIIYPAHLPASTQWYMLFSKHGLFNCPIRLLAMLRPHLIELPLYSAWSKIISSSLGPFTEGSPLPITDWQDTRSTPMWPHLCTVYFMHGHDIYLPTYLQVWCPSMPTMEPWPVHAFTPSKCGFIVSSIETASLYPALSTRWTVHWQ